MKKMSQGWDWAGELGRSFLSEDSMEVGKHFSKAAPLPGGCRWCGCGHHHVPDLVHVIPRGSKDSSFYAFRTKIKVNICIIFYLEEI